jgi:hypothetical protein
VRTTNHDPVKLFRWNKPTKQRGLVDEIEFIAPGKHPETGVLIMLAKESTDGLVLARMARRHSEAAFQGRNVNLLTAVFSEMR